MRAVAHIGVVLLQHHSTLTRGFVYPSLPSSLVSDDNGVTPLMLAVEANSPSMIKWLLDKGADAKKTMASGWMAIHYAVRLGHDSSVLALIQQVGAWHAAGCSQ